ncbi:hypothetical protein OAE39_00255 [Akkermansiaceae bacterium]|nr:hypothetical protein [Akkermansiaceae bacterium]
MTKIYSIYNRAKLKGQNYRNIFRDAKRGASTDIKEDTFNTELDAKPLLLSARGTSSKSRAPK